MSDLARLIECDFGKRVNSVELNLQMPCNWLKSCSALSSLRKELGNLALDLALAPKSHCRAKSANLAPESLISSQSLISVELNLLHRSHTVELNSDELYHQKSPTKSPYEIPRRAISIYRCHTDELYLPI